jgi:hypothetical protein
MKIFPASHYLREFASKEELQSWSTSQRNKILMRIVKSTPSESAWGAFTELLSFWPAESTLHEVIASAEAPMRQWPWRTRHMDYAHPARRREEGIALLTVGWLEMRRKEDLHGSKIQSICEHPHIRGLKGLTFFDVETDPQCLAPVSRSPGLSELEYLELTKLDLKGGLASALGGDQLLSLVELILKDNGISTAELEELVSLPLCRNIETLCLAGNFVNHQNIEILLSGAAFPKIRTLDLSHTFVQSAGLEEKIAGHQLPMLEEIVLKGTPAAKSLGEVITRVTS